MVVLMADKPIQHLPHLAQTASAPSGRIQPRSAKSSPRSASASAAPKLDALANVGLGLGPSYFKSNMPPQYQQYQPLALTGAAAEADMRREQQLEEARRAQMTSANPAAQTKATLLGRPMMNTIPEATMSMVRRSPPRTTQILGSGTSGLTSRMEPPPMTSSPVSMVSPARVPSTPKAPQVYSENIRKRPASPKTNERSRKAMTFPPPPEIIAAEQSVGSRHMSVQAPGTPGSSTPGPSRTSSTAKKHKCPHCATEFTRHHNLKSHLLTHSQEKPFGCQECSSRFRRLHDLKRHLKLHTGERPHICPACGRKFARGDALARHGKGPGGCAGRRGSQGEGDEDEDEEGPEDTTMTEEPEEELESSQRRQSVPNHDPRASSPNVYRTWSSSYPPQFAHQSSSSTTNVSQSRAMYPPRPGPSSTGTSRENSYAMSPTTTNPNPFSSMPFPSPSVTNPAPSLGPGSVSLFSGTMVTESPKPLSPGQGDPMNSAISEPSLSTKMQQTQLQPRLPPPAPHVNALPSLASLPDPRYPGGLTMKPPPPPLLSMGHSSFPPAITVQPATAASGPASAISSSTSHSLSSSGPAPPGSSGSLREMYPVAAQHEARSSVGSVRDLHSSDGPIGMSSTQDSAAVSYIRGIERREQEAQAELAQLRREVEFLRAQVFQLQAQLHHQRHGQGR